MKTKDIWYVDPAIFGQAKGPFGLSRERIGHCVSVTVEELPEPSHKDRRYIAWRRWCDKGGRRSYDSGEKS